MALQNYPQGPVAVENHYSSPAAPPPGAAQERPLPPGWIQEWDSKYQRYYFVDTNKDPPVITWDDPRQNPALYPPQKFGPPAGPPGGDPAGTLPQSQPTTVIKGDPAGTSQSPQSQPTTVINNTYVQPPEQVQSAPQQSSGRSGMSPMAGVAVGAIAATMLRPRVVVRPRMGIGRRC